MSIFLPGEFHGQRSLADCSPWGHEESDRTEWLTLPLSLAGEIFIASLPAIHSLLFSIFHILFLKRYSLLIISIPTPVSITVATIVQRNSWKKKERKYGSKYNILFICRLLVSLFWANSIEYFWFICVYIME